jgi:formate-dependent nitrite reductase membrane component NrfD
MDQPREDRPTVLSFYLGNRDPLVPADPDSPDLSVFADSIRVRISSFPDKGSLRFVQDNSKTAGRKHQQVFERSCQEVSMVFQEAFGGLVAWDLFLGGMGAGAYFFSGLAAWLGAKDRALTRAGVFLGVPLVALGTLLLLADLGRPDRFLMVFMRPSSSMLSIGAIIISLFMMVGFAHMAFLLVPGLKDRLTARLELAIRAAGMFLALATAVYTGLLLGMVLPIPFWNTPVLPVLFLLSALLTGAGLLVLTTALYRRVRREPEDPGIRKSSNLMTRSVMILIGTQLLVFLLLFAIMFNSQPAARESASFLLTGGYASIFWIGVVVIGLLAPLAVAGAMVPRERTISLASMSNVGMLSGVCILAGGLLLRYAVLAAGVTAPLIQ